MAFDHMFWAFKGTSDEVETLVQQVIVELNPGNSISSFVVIYSTTSTFDNYDVFY